MAFYIDDTSAAEFCYDSSMFKKQSLYSLLLFAAAAIWGFAFTAQRIGADYVDPLMFLACRSWLAFIVIFLFRKIRRPVQCRRMRDVRSG
jgi:drug/metabolite transporter (DMT)-like permease